MSSSCSLPRWSGSRERRRQKILREHKEGGTLHPKELYLVSTLVLQLVVDNPLMSPQVGCTYLRKMQDRPGTLETEQELLSSSMFLAMHYEWNTLLKSSIRFQTQGGGNQLGMRVEILSIKI